MCKKLLFNLVVVSSLLISFTGCLEEKALPNDELITIYNSHLKQTRNMHPLDTMYAEIAGMQPEKRYQIKVLDSDKNLITKTDAIAGENGVIKPLPVWFDVGLKRPTQAKPYFHVIDAGIELNAFYINVVDLFDNGDNTDFEQPFYIITTQNKTLEYKKPIVYACTVDGQIDNVFEESNSKLADGTLSPLSKVYVKAEQLPAKTYTNINNLSSVEKVESVDIYVIPFKGINLEDGYDLNNANYPKIVHLSNVPVEQGKDTTYTKLDTTLIWDLNIDPKLINPNDDNNAYVIIIDVNKDGLYTSEVDIDSDTQHYIDGSDGIGAAGFIVLDTPANAPTLPFYTNSNGDRMNAIPEKEGGEEISLYLNLENLTTPASEANVTINGITKTVEIKYPKTTDKVRFLKYIEEEKVFSNSELAGDITEDVNYTVEIYIDGQLYDNNTSITVYPVQTELATYANDNLQNPTSIFDETNTAGGNSIIYLHFGENDSATITQNAVVYFFKHGDLTTPLYSKTLNIVNNGPVQEFVNLNVDMSIINPKESESIYDIVVDSDNNGADSTDKLISVTINNTQANNIPNVRFINIASDGKFALDNHYRDSKVTADYGYVDEFKADGSNTYYARDYKGYDGYGIKAIWNPYIKNKKIGFYANYKGTTGADSTYIDENNQEQESPFNFGQTIHLYIVDASVYSLEADMKLTEQMDVRGFKQEITVQYSCSNGWMIQNIWKAPMKVGKYYVILDMDKDGKLTDGVDLVDAVKEDGTKITDDTSVVGFSVIE